MFGIGFVELIILIAIALLLFGVPVLTFLFGYALGKKEPAPPESPASEASTPEPPESPASETSKEPSADE